MSEEQRPTSAVQTAAAKPVPHVHITPSGREALKLFEHEIAAYRRELPRLLEEGHAWRHALVKGDEVLSVWDTQSDAIQAGGERFGLEPYYVKTIDPRDPERFTWLDAALKESPCPSS